MKTSRDPPPRARGFRSCRFLLQACVLSPTWQPRIVVDDNHIVPLLFCPSPPCHFTTSLLAREYQRTSIAGVDARESCQHIYLGTLCVAHSSATRSHTSLRERARRLNRCIGF